ncbi:TPA: YihY family inner membrane protein [Neisseria gonorrhoeae]|uniref:YihY family inner membrane protein n=1 Tax=Neisseria gonorrhoeae TaxID=485 RepID=UPI0001AF3B64|nr:YihY family inner membrane protein [Neisseria gonorrhoeae]KLR99642.1 ribonuclease BN [Neisseria gonorrhoeae SK708]EEZ54112.1 tRNA-processing ribonuclease BN [Neisseria gonorrhoeae PID332]KDN01367.1 ribonuclease BN [Neisseria gonorrhoeae]KLR81099.1 ribonuclease BN [Neisseria gonorrhoeae SK8976]MCC9010095.1 YihY family inner membrane protein [Neisseria gonorrhoeae]
MTFLQRWQGLADNKICAFAWFVIRRFSEERVPQAAASMTFTTLLALVPVLTVMVAVASIFPVFDRWSDSFVSFVNQTIVPQGADMVFDYIDAFRDQANRLTAIGSVMLVVTSLMLIRTIDNAFNHIWRVNTQRPWMMQFLVYWALLTSGPLSLGVGISFMVGSVQDSVLSSGAQQWADALKTAARLAFMTVLLWGLYRFVPNRFVPARQAFVGALITAFCLETARFLFTWYMGNFDGYRSIYGAFAAVPFFLLWLNLLWTLVLGGAVLTSSLSYWQGEAFRRGFDSRGRFDDVLKILLLLDAAQKEGKALPVPEFRRHINMGYDELGELLEKLARYGYTYSGRQGWVLKTGADSIELSELFKLFVYRPLPVERDHVNQAVDAVMTPCLQTLNMTLAEFDAQAKKQQQS